MAEKPQKSVYFKNRKAEFEYFLFDKIEAGIVLLGAEVKSIKIGGCDISKAHVMIHWREMEMYVIDLHIKKLEHTAADGLYNPIRPRKLLVHKSEIRKMSEKTKQDGFTIVPTSLYVNRRNLVKVEIALAKGKKLHDKRDTIRARDLEREGRKSDEQF